MSGRRLPLHAAPAPVSADASAAPRDRLRLPGCSLAVADTGTCELAVRWAGRLVTRLVERGARPRVLLTSFDAWIHLSVAQRCAFGEGTELRTLALAGGAALPDDLLSGDDALWVLVGQPALLSFDSSLSVLLGTSLPVLRWPENMRTLRSGCTLSLAGEGLEIASALAELLPLG